MCTYIPIKERTLVVSIFGFSSPKVHFNPPRVLMLRYYAELRAAKVELFRRLFLRTLRINMTFSDTECRLRFIAKRLSMMFSITTYIVRLPIFYSFLYLIITSSNTRVYKYIIFTFSPQQSIFPVMPPAFPRFLRSVH